jgi:hypothetical protein
VLRYCTTPALHRCLESIRPRGLPAFLGVSSENPAHRLAVESGDSEGQLQEGVFIPRCETNSWVNALAGGRLFPGETGHFLSLNCERCCVRSGLRILGSIGSEDVSWNVSKLFPTPAYATMRKPSFSGRMACRRASATAPMSRATTSLCSIASTSACAGIASTSVS